MAAALCALLMSCIMVTSALVELANVQVRIFNLDDVRPIRDLDPIDIDGLVAIKGMITRTGNIIPDLRSATQQFWLLRTAHGCKPLSLSSSIFALQQCRVCWGQQRSSAHQHV
jgi:DNA replicative helicase MCM subunit Mcm2 (Cdc46/Mcm family)